MMRVDQAKGGLTPVIEVVPAPCSVDLQPRVQSVTAPPVDDLGQRLAAVMAELAVARAAVADAQCALAVLDLRRAHAVADCDAALRALKGFGNSLVFGTGLAFVGGLAAAFLIWGALG